MSICNVIHIKVFPMMVWESGYLLFSCTNQAAFCATGENCVTGNDYVIGIMSFGSLLNMH